jgi:universal stress protein A
LLHELQSTLSADVPSDVPCDWQVEVGEPVDRIIDFANAHHNDLIVMGSHGKSGISRWLFGSVAESVMRKANCPVFIVKHHENSPAEMPLQT